jgi:MATE family multidrug resistance protein
MTATAQHQKTIVRLALPVVAGLSIQTLLFLFDTALIGRLPDAKEELAALGIVFYLTWAIIGFFSSISTGTQVLTSRHVGDEDCKACSSVLSTSLIAAAGLGFVVSVAVTIFAHDIAGYLTADTGVADAGAGYLFYRFLGIPFYLVAVVFRGFFFGTGKTRVFMVAAIAAILLNMILDYVFIFGAFEIQGMALAGAGLGASIAAAVEVLVYLFVIGFGRYRAQFGISWNLRFDKIVGRSLLNIAVPVSFQSVLTIGGILLYVAIIGVLGTVQQAASQLVLSALLLSYLPSSAFGITAQTLVGRRLGENDILHARQWGFETSRTAVGYTTMLGLVFMIMPGTVLSMLTGNGPILDAAVPVLRIAGLGQIFFGIGLVLANGLLAAGESFFVMVTDVSLTWLVLVPVGYLTGIILKLGLVAVWTAMPLYAGLYALVIFIKFRFGPWKTASPTNAGPHMSDGQTLVAAVRFNQECNCSNTA